ncbi:MIP/aquaporin family protein [Myceligenerans pegani]|uniref:Aquaporin n=1 Tax=Myceligenerans pegani TaxID=2776917 RepID=A0ABR9MTP7_9MICO|nr:aquaporin [Myceligenerans sp. TRM 65318]MBE1874760.1 aquaporin [Myceligenerans sp. TRM 65318]MBE3017031.1 aquaporin [Myceligenerans sp. TRM 65318]
MANAYAVPDGALDAPTETSGSGTLSRVLAEAFGTFVLVLGVLSIGVYSFLNQSGAIGVALTGGFAYAAALIAVGHVSGGWFNPAITLAQAIAGRVRWAEVPLYWLAQLVGGFAAGALLLATLPDKLFELLGREDNQALYAQGANGWGDFSPLYTLSQGGATFTMLQAGMVELVASAALAGIALAVGTKNRAAMAAAGGLGLAVLSVVAYPVTGAGLNPVRSTVAAVFSNDWGGVSGQVWLFWVAPLVGAGIAALFAVAFGSQETAEEVAASNAEAYDDADDDADQTDDADDSDTDDSDVADDDTDAAEKKADDDATSTVEKKAD